MYLSRHVHSHKQPGWICLKNLECSDLETAPSDSQDEFISALSDPGSKQQSLIPTSQEGKLNSQRERFPRSPAHQRWPRAGGMWVSQSPGA